MNRNDATAATVTVMRGPTVLYEKGYGHLDTAKTKPLPADAMMLIASTVKPVTAAAIQKLVAAGTLKTSDHAFCTGSNAPCWLPANLLSPGSDPRAKDITILHLITHSGGWDRTVSGELADIDVRRTFALSTVPTAGDNVRYWMQRPLNFAPGSNAQYSNFGYKLLGMIIEQASGMRFVDYVNANIFTPLGIPATDFKVAPMAKNRTAREPDRIDNEWFPSVYELGAMVKYTDGFRVNQNWVSEGTGMATSKALARFASHYRIDASVTNGGMDGAFNGIPLGETTNSGFHGGNLPGCLAIVRQLPSGISYAVLVNSRANSANFDLQQRMDAAIAGAGL